MDKWVKAQNSQKESGFKKPLAPISLPPKAKPSGAADAGFNVIAKVILSFLLYSHNVRCMMIS